MTTETAILDLPPAPPAYVEVGEHFAVLHAKEFVAAMKGGDHEPPHDHVEDAQPAPPPSDLPPGDSFRVQQEVIRRSWNRSEHDGWREAARRMSNFNQSGKDSTPSTAVLDLPPAPPAYVETCQRFSASESRDVLAALKDGGHHDPLEPSYDPDDEGPREYRLHLEPGTISVTGSPLGLTRS